MLFIYQVILPGGVHVPYAVVRDACSYGKVANDKDSLHGCVSVLVDFFMPNKKEQADHSLTGIACKSIKGSVDKKQFPPKQRDAIFSKRFKKLYAELYI